MRLGHRRRFVPIFLPPLQSVNAFSRIEHLYESEHMDQVTAFNNAAADIEAEGAVWIPRQWLDGELTDRPSSTKASLILLELQTGSDLNRRCTYLTLTRTRILEQTPGFSVCAASTESFQRHVARRIERSSPPRCVHSLFSGDPRLILATRRLPPSCKISFLNGSLSPPRHFLVTSVPPLSRTAKRPREP